MTPTPTRAGATDWLALLAGLDDECPICQAGRADTEPSWIDAVTVAEIEPESPAGATTRRRSRR